MKKKIFNKEMIILLTGLIVIILIVANWWYEQSKDYSKGELKLEISLDKEVIKISRKYHRPEQKYINVSEVFNITVKLSNIGNTDVKLLPFEYGETFRLYLYQSDGNEVNFIIWDWWVDCRLPWENYNLFILRSKESVEERSEIYLFDFEGKPDNYTMKMVYYVPSKDRIGNITDSFWKGEIESNILTLRIVGDET